MIDPLNRWFNARWFSYTATVVILILAFLLVMNRGRMDSQNSAKQGRQTSLPEIPSVELVSVVVIGQTVTLQWNPNSEPDLAGYRIGYGPSSGNYANILPVGINSTMVTINNLTPGTYFASVKAFDADGFESPYSTEVSFVMVASTPSPAPTATPTATARATATATPTATPTATVAPTPTATPSPIPNFTLSTLPVSQTITSNATYRQVNFQTVVTKTGGFNTLVMLTISGLPTGIERSFDGNPTNTKRNLKLYSAGFVPPGTYIITVTGQGGLNPALIHTSTATLTVTP